MKEFRSFCKNWDFFADSFTFRIKSKRGYTSVVGGLSSLLFLICSVIYFLNNMINWLNKSSFSSTFELMQISESKLNFEDHQYFSIGFCLKNNKYLSDPYLLKSFDFSLNMAQKEVFNKTLSFDTFPISLQKCTANHFKDNNKILLENIEFEGCQCLNVSEPIPSINLKNNEKNLVLRTYSDILLHQFLQFKLTIKPGIIANKKNLDELNAYLTANDSRLHVYFPDYSMKINNLSQPLNIHLKTIEHIIKPYSSRHSDVKFAELSLKDYSSIFSYECKL